MSGPGAGCGRPVGRAEDGELRPDPVAVEPVGRDRHVQVALGRRRREPLVTRERGQHPRFELGGVGDDEGPAGVGLVGQHRLGRRPGPLPHRGGRAVRVQALYGRRRPVEREGQGAQHDPILRPRTDKLRPVGQRRNGPVTSNVTPPECLPDLPRCEEKYSRVPSGENAGPAISDFGWWS